MWPLGHLSGAYLLGSGYQKYRSGRALTDEAVVAVALGSQLPDLVDKPLGWYLGVLPGGRTFAHSLLAVVPLAVFVAVLTDRYDRSACGVAFLLGVFSHLFFDALPALWSAEKTGSFLLWPLLSVTTYDSGPELLALFADTLGEPYFAFEFVLFTVALVSWVRDGCPGTRSLVSLAHNG